VRKIILFAVGAVAAFGCGVAPVSAQTATSVSAPYDLNGEWQAEYHNPEGVMIERIMIVNIASALTATKTTGDQYVPAGKMTLRATLPTAAATTFPAQQQCAGAGYVNPQWGDVTLTIINNDHFTLRHDCPSRCACGTTDTWQRVGKPTLALDNAILFDFDKSQLRSNAGPILDKVVAWLVQRHPASHLLIAGYTDNIGSAAHNLQLSKQRAEKVAAALAAKGIAKSRLATRGFGATNPRYPNTNDDARARNRRVEIVIED